MFRRREEAKLRSREIPSGTRGPGSRGVGRGCLWSPCPPASACGRHLLLYLRPKAPPPAAPEFAVPPRRHCGALSVRKPNPAVAGRPLRVSKGGGRSRRRRPGDMERKGLPATAGLKQPTRTRRGQRHEVPIRSCSRWGLPCRPVTRLAVRSYRTISPLPRIPEDCSGVSFCCISVGSRRPGATRHRALWSPDCSRHPEGRSDCRTDAANGLGG